MRNGFMKELNYNGNMTDLLDTQLGAEKKPNVITHMDRVKRLISPGSKRKLIGVNVNKTFGVPLEDLVKRSPRGSSVPAIVKKLCDYIDKNGLDEEGVFRINGNSRIVEKIKTSFDQTGDADLDEDHDVMAVAGCLKLFLREMPDSTIPEALTSQFVAIQESNQSDYNSCVQLLKLALKELPTDNYNLLKYLIQFLVIVAYHESINKMNASALGIVFGPNLFRCGQGLSGLKDQGIINQITTKFIMEYNELFKLDFEDSPIVLWEKRRQKVPPPRPPPPKVSVHIEEMRPIPSPRKTKTLENGDDVADDWDKSDDDSMGVVPSLNNIEASPRTNYSDEEYTGRASPFGLDSEGYSMIESPVVTARTSKAVDKVISDTITGLIFGGDDDFSVSPEKDTSSIATDSEVYSQGGQSFSDRDEVDSHGPSIQICDLINKFETTDEKDGDVTFLTKSKQRPNSTAFEFFESQGVLIAQAQGPMSKSIHSSNSNVLDEFVQDNEFEAVKSDNLLSGFKKPAGPLRRTPSRKGRKSFENEDQALEELLHETDMVASIDNKFRSSKSNNKIETWSNRQQEEKENIQQLSPERSPGNSRKPFIPPLDLTILHEHVDSSVPIPAMKIQSQPYVTNVEHENDKENEEDLDPSVILSPRSSKLKKKNGVALNTDIPPSPPVDQDRYRKHGAAPDDEISHKLRQLTKKIQVYKKKIKNFEESFERENGFRPSHSEKSSRPEVKKLVTDLSKARKDLKKLKEEAEMGSRSRHGSGASSSGERTDPPNSITSVEHTLETLLKKLEDKRIEANRPHDLTLMKREEIQDEKLAIQKSLLHFENLHGRPTNKIEKDLMRPLYDRYRSVKRLLAKPISPRDTVELETVPEDHPIEIISVPSSQVAPVKIPTGEIEDDDEDEIYDQLGTLDFVVTRDFNVLKDTINPSTDLRSTSNTRKKTALANTTEWKSTESNLHELDIHELHDELHQTKSDKRRMRKQLREFEDEFFERTGRKVQKDDRQPLQEEYNAYKQVKARMRLLEALIAKHNSSEA